MFKRTGRKIWITALFGMVSVFCADSQISVQTEAVTLEVGALEEAADEEGSALFTGQKISDADLLTVTISDACSLEGMSITGFDGMELLDVRTGLMFVVSEYEERLSETDSETDPETANETVDGKACETACETEEAAAAAEASADTDGDDEGAKKDESEYGTSSAEVSKTKSQSSTETDDTDGTQTNTKTEDGTKSETEAQTASETKTETEAETASETKTEAKSETESETDLETEEEADTDDQETDTPDSEGDSEGSSTHTHSWTAVTQTIYHEAVTQEVWVVDQEAYDEEIVESHNFCKKCGLDMTAAGVDVEVHMADGCESTYYAKRVVVDTIHYDEVGHYETVTVTEAYTETVITGYVCESCGTQK